jgi:hypothetical protein
LGESEICGKEEKSNRAVVVNRMADQNYIFEQTMKGLAVKVTAKKVTTMRKWKAAKRIVWNLGDNLCLVYAMWEMLTAQQQSLITVRVLNCVH